jgi:hypothetical protein
LTEEESIPLERERRLELIILVEVETPLIVEVKVFTAEVRVF